MLQNAAAGALRHESLTLATREHDVMLRAQGLHKTFHLHAHAGAVDAQIPALDSVDLTVRRGECVALVGPSGAGKSTLLRCLYGNYLANAGRIEIRHDDGRGEHWVDLTTATAREVLSVRRTTLGYVSQFLRVIPRVSTLDIVAEPLRRLGVDAQDATAKARALLDRLNIPERLWTLAPATFSGGEQQRINIARGLIAAAPVLLLDEPTASLDAQNRAVVAQLIAEARAAGSAIVGIFHDEATRDEVATRTLAMRPVLRPAH
ncbi:phosphonate C-P lyase system protein PhnL [Pandoraea norimbergensis]|uniref:Alpha-D-ribose 1-methylphosphonate 5-triphosphate synthase subunit PhnL n=2 Tax=Pandoraea norimbergensis TaxID=93219 RepID=A0ABM5WIS0_9BURK|nr:phosphonate C-P lyase system protein PhnL [Pandoraea norimbergensis]